MAKKKQKKAPITGTDLKQQRAHRISRLKETCELLLGKGTFSIFTPTDLQYLLEHFHSSPRMIAQLNAHCSQDEAGRYKAIFNDQMRTRKITTVTGAEISLAQFLKEGLTLIFYVQGLVNEHPKTALAYAELFEPYLDNKDPMLKPISEAVYTALQLSNIESDWSTQLMHYSAADFVGFSNTSYTNEIKVWFKPLPKESLEINGKKREILQMGWCDSFGKFDPVHILPEHIGLKHSSKSKIPAYIQRHALQRIEERLGMLNGVVQYQIYLTFKKENHSYQSQGDNTLLELEVFGKKLGYLVCSVHQDKIIVRTFLFLTNEGSPEGKLLGDISSLAIPDKQYLDLDTLPGIRRYNLHSNSQLSDLFIHAGCSQLLDLSSIKPLFRSESTDKDPNLLLQYLMMQKPVNEVWS